MSRMLEALRQIEAQCPPPCPIVRPVSPEELESYGLRRAPAPERQEPPPAAQPVPEAEAIEPAESPQPDEGDSQAPSPESLEMTAPSDPDEVKPSGQEGEAPPAEATLSVTAAPTAPVRESSRNVRRLLSPLADEHGAPYRQLAHNILAQLPPGQPAVLMFTSPSNQGAKTGVLAALAVAIAEEVAADVVVVDADFRSPALAGDFGIWGDRGLADVLTGERGAEIGGLPARYRLADVLTGERDWRQVVRKTSAKHLSVLPGGRFPGEDDSLPGDAKLASLLQTLRRSHRLVLVNTASLQYPEVAPLSGLCDGTYLVVALGRTERDAARRAVRLIKRCGGRVLGCVLTDVSSAS